MAQSLYLEIRTPDLVDARNRIRDGLDRLANGGFDPRETNAIINGAYKMAMLVDREVRARKEWPRIRANEEAYAQQMAKAEAEAAAEAERAEREEADRAASRRRT